MLRRINAPGIQLNEIDRSQYDSMPDYSIVGTTCFICGFADKGENYSIKWINTLQTLIDNYGYPQTEEERYFWNACVEVLNNGGICLAARLPYANSALSTLPYVQYEIASDVSSIPYGENENLAQLSTADGQLTSYTEIRYKSSGYIQSDQYDDLIVNKNKVAQNSIQIVGIQNAQYGKISAQNTYDIFEDYECAGKLPVVITPANALFFQNLIKSEYEAQPITISTLIPEPCVFNKVKRTYGYYSDKSNYKVDSSCFTGNAPGPYKLEYILTSDTGKIAISSMLTALGFKQDDSDTFISSILNGQISYKNLTFSNNTITDIIPARSYLTTYQLAGDEYTQLTSQYIDSYNVITGIKNVECDYAFNIKDSSFSKNLNSIDKNEYTVSKEAASIFQSFTKLNDLIDNREQLKLIGIVVFDVLADASNKNKIDLHLSEAYIGSLDHNARSADGSSLFIDDIVNNESPSIRVFSRISNTKIKRNNRQLTNHEYTSIYYAVPSAGTVLGQSESRNAKTIDYNVSISKALNMIYDKACDRNKYFIDLLIDAGVSNIAQAYYTWSYNISTVNPTSATDPNGDILKSMKLTNNNVSIWKSVIQKYDTFCKNMRKDCMFIADGPRGFALDNDEKIVRDTAPLNTLDEHVLTKLNFVGGINTSYGAGYIDWFKGVDAWSGMAMWIPPSIKALGIYIYTDAYWNKWDAPAGLNRGRVQNVVDCAFSPNQEQAGRIYLQGWNYACNYPIDGIVLEGQKTFQKQKTAFDRINVRRLFLYLEKEVERIARYFVYEGNTAWQRQRFVDAITPLFENAKQRNGIIDYIIKCDEDNNTPNTIDNNELRCSIAIKPVKTIEFILLNFICTNQSASVSEEVLR